eukprot:6207045-Pleurochrysis_carterae.AAC.2
MGTVWRCGKPQSSSRNFRAQSSDTWQESAFRVESQCSKVPNAVLLSAQAAASNLSAPASSLTPYLFLAAVLTPSPPSFNLAVAFAR